ncbi:hypothetical protein SMICM304S_00109 [Streptomyces microflavus]
MSLHALRPAHIPGDYVNHWVKVGADTADQSKLPKIYYVNWFRKQRRR